MKGAQIANVLSRTLSPSTIQSSSRELQSMRGCRGFAVDLLVISDSTDYNAAVRQSAIIYLKNIVQDHCSRQPCISSDDLENLKANLLEAIIRNATNQQLAPTLKEIIFQMAEKYYPKEWPQIVEDALRRLTNATQFNEILGCVEALRAIFSVFGGSVMKEIQLGNLSNKTVLPLFTLASRLFQNFNPDTSVILLSLFKLFSVAIQFHMPAIIAINIHNLMIFVKKVLDLRVELDDNNTSLYQLKRICLRILFRIYQRHANPKITEDRAFAQQFHSKYTRSFVETLVYQVLAESGNSKNGRRRHMQLLKMSLSCLAYINRQSPDAAALLMQHRESLIGLCLQRLRLNFGRGYQNFADFRMYIQENRVQLKEFFFSLMRCEALPDQQNTAVSVLLGLLLGCLKDGDNELKELALYVFTEMSTEIHFLSTSLEENMTQLIVNFVKPLLREDQHVLVRMRACHLLASYNYLELPEEHLVELATAVYNCLLANGQQKQVFLRIYACNAFNSLLKYAPIIDFVRPNLQQILRIYTSLLQADVSIIKNFEDLLNLLQQQIAPFANDLVLLLTNLFRSYASRDGSSPQNVSQGDGGEEEDDDDDESMCEEDDSNNESIAKACISSIRQILQAERAQLSQKAREELFLIMVDVFSDQSQLYIEQGFNILNLLLYKLQGQVNEQYYLFFKTIAYAILGLPPNWLDSLKNGNTFQVKYAQILENNCVQPDKDFLENSIGCLRNFIAKSSREALHSYRDEFGTTLVDTLMRIVQFIHENQNGKSSQTDRLIVLTIYVSLIEYQVLNEAELQRVIGNVLNWIQMEQEAVQQRETIAPPSRFVYSAIYLQIILLAVHFYRQIAIDLINLPVILQRLLFLQENFRCDYELARVIVGISDILNLKAVNDQQLGVELMRILPEIVRRTCKLRTQGDNQLNDFEMDDQAEEDRLLGHEDNSMMLGWQQPAASQKDLQLQEDEEDDNDWEEEFNKFYDSPLDKIDEIKWLENVLKGEGRPYFGLLNISQQEEISLYFTNAPPKQ